jgi:hypothetical protein
LGDILKKCSGTTAIEASFCNCFFQASAKLKFFFVVGFFRKKKKTDILTDSLSQPPTVVLLTLTGWIRASRSRISSREKHEKHPD